MLRDMDFRRVEMLTDDRRARRRRRRASRPPSTAPARGRSSPSRSSPPCSPPRSSWKRSLWRPRFAFSRASLRDLGGFSAYMLGQRMLWYLQSNGDRFLIGRFLGTAALGVYAVAYNTMLVPASKLGGPLQRVFSPAFSRIQDEPERIAATWARVGAPAGRRLGARARRPDRRGARLRAARARRPVDRGGAGRSRSSPGSGSCRRCRPSTWTSCSRAGARGRCSASRSSLTTATSLAFAVGLQWGVIGVAVAYAISTTLVEPAQTVLAARALDVSPMVFVRAICGRLPGRARHVPGRPRAARRRSSTPACAAGAAARRSCIARRRRRLRRALPVARAGAAPRRGRAALAATAASPGALRAARRGLTAQRADAPSKLVACRASPAGRIF